MADLRIVRFRSKTPTWWRAAERKVGAGVMLGYTLVSIASFVMNVMWVPLVFAPIVALPLTRIAIRRRARKVPGTTDFATLEAVADRAQVRLRGRARAVDGATSARVVRRIDARVVVADGLLRREHLITLYEAEDFALVDAHGSEVMVRGAAVEIVAGRTQRTKAPEEVVAQLEALDLGLSVPAGSTLRVRSADVTDISDGQEIELLGTKTREADADAAALPRDTPWRAVITAGELPVLIFL